MTETVQYGSLIQNDNVIKNYGLKIGLIAGLTELGIMYGTYYSGMDIFLNIKVYSKFVPYIIILLLITGLALRRKNKGYLSLKEGLQFAFLAYVISELMTAAGTYILYNVIDKDLTAKSITIGVERTKIMMNKLNATQAETDEAVKAVQSASGATGFKRIFLGMGTDLIFDFLKSMLLAFVIKKERKDLLTNS